MDDRKRLQKLRKILEKPSAILLLHHRGLNLNKTILVGTKEISNYTGRSWNTILDWIENRGFPARMIDSRWESDKQLIDNWRRIRLLGADIEKIQ